jgi:hypothetical protein
VNDIAKGCDLPLSTVQRYLSQQTYFKKTLRRKWDLPEKVSDELVNRQENTRLGLLGSSLETQAMLVGTQLDEVRESYETMLKQINAMQPLLMRQTPPVADKATVTHPSLNKLNDYITSMTKAIKMYISNVPEEYQELLKNLEIPAMIVGMGLEYMNSDSNSDLTGVLLGSNDTLTPETLKILETYQKGD